MYTALDVTERIFAVLYVERQFSHLYLQFFY